MIHSFFITPDGQSRSVYTDELISFYEQLEDYNVERASTVEYDNEMGLWIAEDAETGLIISMQPNRQDAIDDEIDYLKDKFKSGKQSQIMLEAV